MMPIFWIWCVSSALVVLLFLRKWSGFAIAFQISFFGWCRHVETICNWQLDWWSCVRIESTNQNKRCGIVVRTGCKIEQRLKVDFIFFRGVLNVACAVRTHNNVSNADVKWIDWFKRWRVTLINDSWPKVYVYFSKVDPINEKFVKHHRFNAAVEANTRSKWSVWTDAKPKYCPFSTS